jgi:coenzyme F420-reducing hydrogenase beta subunit
VKAWFPNLLYFNLWFPYSNLRRYIKDVIAPSCYSCFDYVNGLADLVVGYMGVPYYHTVGLCRLNQVDP